ncbi:MAG: hypothetical protein M1833_005742 [Piccolia ochrophora]|nr:MAG: hypothetical protein M1833_005742 [Piccolia ochrophora]
MSMVQMLCAAFAAWLFLQVGQALFNIFLHPLARFPGPLGAAATSWWKVYHELLKDESVIHKYIELHKHYGDTIRVGPNELHFRSSSAYNEIYNSQNRWAKHGFFYKTFGSDEASFTFLAHHEAKQRRDILNPFFSKRAISDMQDLIQDNVHHAIQMDSYQTSFRTQRQVEPRNGWDSVSTTDLEMLAKRVSELSLHPKLLEDTPHATIFHDLLNPKASLDGTVPSSRSLRDEAQALVFAGTDTVGNTLMIGVFQVLAHPEVYQKLKTELSAAWPSLDEAPSWTELEQLPYLTAVIKESLRVSNGVSSGLPRVVPSSGARICGESIPAGTIVGTSSLFVHGDESIFPNNAEFLVDRWLEPSSKQLDASLVSFSRGPRRCLGMNLAWCELYLAFANVFRKFEIQLDGTRLEDLHWKDRFLPQYDGPHLRAFMKPVAD